MAPVFATLCRLSARPFASVGAAALLLGAYLLLHAATRLWLWPGSLGYDDAEQVLFAQAWSLGYRFQQPPLVTWLVLALSDLVGLAPGLLSITVLRTLLLAALHVTFFLAARHWLGDGVRAALASAALAATYTLGFLAHGDLLVSTSLAVAVATSLWLWGRLLARPTLPNTLAFGVVCGLGLLAKWNFVMLALAYLLVGLALPAYRGLVLSWRTPVVVAVASLIAGPSALWVLAHHPSFIGLGQEVLIEPAARRSALDGLQALVRSALAFPQPVLLLALVALWPALGPLPPRVRPLAWVMVVAFALHLLLIPLAGAVNFPERWMITVLLALPIVLFAAVPPGHPRLAGAALAILLVVVVALGARATIGLTDAAYCGKCRTRLPTEAFVEGLREAGMTPSRYVTSDMHLGGNLQAALGDAGQVVMQGYPESIWPRGAAAPCILLWRHDAPLPPDGSGRDVGQVRAPILGRDDRLQGIAFRRLDDGAACP